jgi:hypothetical protein
VTIKYKNDGKTAQNEEYLRENIIKYIIFKIKRSVEKNVKNVSKITEYFLTIIFK